MQLIVHNNSNIENVMYKPAHSRNKRSHFFSLCMKAQGMTIQMKDIQEYLSVVLSNVLSVGETTKYDYCVTTQIKATAQHFTATLFVFRNFTYFSCFYFGHLSSKRI